MTTTFETAPVEAVGRPHALAGGKIATRPGSGLFVRPHLPSAMSRETLGLAGDRVGAAFKTLRRSEETP
ncbi:hypothetical protein [Ensifer soli]|uniref:hypothetical protein n=1 Tax=Ciceribacter sp. sgz301302 TaxID=3342379 RepID=UPI0035BB6C12